MIWLVNLALNWLRTNGVARIYLSPTPTGTRIGGHDIQQLANEYLVLDVRAGQRVILLGYFELT